MATTSKGANNDYDIEAIIEVNLLDVSEMDKAVRSSLDLGWNLIPGVIEHASLVGSFRIIIECFPVIHNPPPMPDGTNGYFSVAAGDFVKEEISEKRTTTILSTIASAGGAFGVIGAILVCLFGSRILDMWGFARKIAVNTWYWVDSLKRGWETLKRDWETLKRGWETLKNSCESDSDSQKNSNNTW
ncbi:666_t:CDS:2 [Entrophospora sp. SA101]|nr:666_t:CDS:2 [Entrophospora sp. SA101]